MGTRKEQSPLYTSKANLEVAHPRQLQLRTQSLCGCYTVSAVSKLKAFISQTRKWRLRGSIALTTLHWQNTNAKIKIIGNFSYQNIKFLALAI